jgi:hypothetical protein
MGEKILSLSLARFSPSIEHRSISSKSNQITAIGIEMIISAAVEEIDLLLAMR